MEINNRSVNNLAQRLFDKANVSTLYDSMPELVPGSSTSSSAGTIEFPSDYARTGEVASAAGSVVNSLDAIANKLDTMNDIGELENKDLESPPDSNFDDTFFKNTFGPLLGWKLPAHTSACPTVDFDIFGTQILMNSHCLIAEDNRTVLSSIMMVVWLLVALFVLLRA